MFGLFHHLLAAVTYTTSYSNSSSGLTQQQASGVTFVTLIIVGVFALVAIIATLIGMWKTFEKAGRPGWASIIPVYSSWVLFEIGGKPGWWALLSLLGFIPVVNVIAGIITLALSVLAYVEISKRFGMGGGFAVLLVFFPTIGFLILGFGKAQYSTGSDSLGAAPGYGPQVPSAPATPVAPVAPITSQVPQPSVAQQPAIGVVQPGIVSPASATQAVPPANQQVSPAPQAPAPEQVSNGPITPTTPQV